MREIKFRAWNDDKKEFIYSYNLRCFVQEKHHKFDAGGAHDDYVDFPDYDFDVEQYTGLKDVNGKEIYEGDITYVKSELVNFATNQKTGKFSESLHFIEWNEDGWATRIIKNISNYPGTIGHLSKGLTVHSKYCEVIGNLHENPELLEG